MKSARYGRARDDWSHPTFADSFPGYLRGLNYHPDGSRRRVNPTLHLLHWLGDAPGFNCEALAWYRAHGVLKLAAYLTDGTILRISLKRFSEKAGRCEGRGFEPQMGCHRRYWVADVGAQLRLLV
jgi:hypothetical protein